MTAVPGPAARCATHPSRIALDLCPTCERPRCGADGVRGVGVRSGDCPACRREREVVALEGHREASDVERLVRAALAASATALACGVVSSQYVGAGYFAYFLPGIAGLLTGGAGMRAAGLDGRGPLAQRVRLVTLLYALIGTGYSFALVIGRADPFALDALLPYAATALGVYLGTRPPPTRTRRKVAPRGQRGTDR